MYSYYQSCTHHKVSGYRLGICEEIVYLAEIHCLIGKSVI